MEAKAGKSDVGLSELEQQSVFGRDVKWTS